MDEKKIAEYTAGYKDELQDAIKKVELSKSASDHTDQCLLRDMAREELQHAKMLKHMLERAGAFKEDEELVRLKTDAKKALESV